LNNILNIIYFCHYFYVCRPVVNDNEEWDVSVGNPSLKFALESDEEIGLIRKQISSDMERNFVVLRRFLDTLVPVHEFYMQNSTALAMHSSDETGM